MAVMFFDGWWEPLGGTEKVFWGIAIIFSVLLLILLLVSQIGLHFRNGQSTEEQISELNSDRLFFKNGLRLVSIRSIIAFFAFFGWTGIVAFEKGYNVSTTISLAIVVGLIAMFLANFLIYFYSRFIRSGNYELAKVLYKTGEVQRLVPANQNGLGKVRIIVRGKLKEVDAMTRGDALPSGAIIKVTEVLDNDMVLVDPVTPFTM